jgi:hypothetical protein
MGDFEMVVRRISNCLMYNINIINLAFDIVSVKNENGKDTPYAQLSREVVPTRIELISKV